MKLAIRVSKVRNRLSSYGTRNQQAYFLVFPPVEGSLFVWSSAAYGDNGMHGMLNETFVFPVYLSKAFPYFYPHMIEMGISLRDVYDIRRPFEEAGYKVIG